MEAVLTLGFFHGKIFRSWGICFFFFFFWFGVFPWLLISICFTFNNKKCHLYRDSGSNIWEPEDGNSSQNFGRCYFKERQPKKLDSTQSFRVVVFNQKRKKTQLVKFEWFAEICCLISSKKIGAHSWFSQWILPDLTKQIGSGRPLWYVSGQSTPISIRINSSTPIP